MLPSLAIIMIRPKYAYIRKKLTLFPLENKKDRVNRRCYNDTEVNIPRKSRLLSDQKGIMTPAD